MLTATASRKTLRFLNINVWSGLDYTGTLKMGAYEPAGRREKRYQALVAQIKALDPDVIGVQEANMLPDYAQRLAADLEYAVFYHVGVGGLRIGPIGLPWNLREGDVLLAKPDLSPTFAGRRQLSGGYVGNVVTVHFSNATQILAIKIINQNRSLFVFVTHWHASLLHLSDVTQQANPFVESGKWRAAEYEKMISDIAQGAAWRFLEAQKTVEFIRTTAGASPFVLMGDFNALDRSPEITHLLTFGMVDAFRAVRPEDPGFTWDPRTNLNHQLYYRKMERQDRDRSLSDTLTYFRKLTPKRIDYIFVGPATEVAAGHLSVKSSRVVLNNIINGVHASDHYGVFAEISFAVSSP